MAVYYSSNVNYYQQEPIFPNHQQQQQEASSSSAEHVRNEMVFIPPTTGAGGDVLTGLQNLNGTVSSRDPSFHDGQGLSLTLGNQISLPSFHHHQQYHHQLAFTPNNPSISVKETPPFNVEEEKSKEMMSSLLLLCQSNPSSGYAAGLYNNYRYNETSGGFMMSSVLRSRYLKPAQSLLEEMVSVKKEMRNKKMKGQDFNNDSKDTESGELSTTELQNKKNKLLAMVDEVDKRYNQYYHQMEALASSFEIVAGFGASKPYTSVALNKISRSFRSLRDAIEEQIQIIREKLGEKGGGDLSLDEQQQQGGGGERIPRLRYLDQRLRQQRAFHQQIGMVRPSWRPQRGLPENSVSALRAWLFEHFLHPYPKDSEKMMLAKQTGLSKNQVANWFINARVRVWKPMIEDIYKQEFGEDESELRISKSSQEPNITNQEDSSSSQQQPEDNNNTAYPSADATKTVFSSDEPKQQEMNRSGDYETLLNNYQGYVMEEDYRYNNIGGNNQQDSRFSNAHHHLHDFVV